MVNNLFVHNQPVIGANVFLANICYSPFNLLFRLKLRSSTVNKIATTLTITFSLVTTPTEVMPLLSDGSLIVSGKDNTSLIMKMHRRATFNTPFGTTKT